MFESGQSKVGGSSRITTLFAKYSYAHVSLLYHRHIVSSVSDCTSNWLTLARLDYSNNLFKQNN